MDKIPYVICPSQVGFNNSKELLTETHGTCVVILQLKKPKVRAAEFFLPKVSGLLTSKAYL